MTLDVRLIELEKRWHEADAISQAARSQLAASNRLSTAETLAISIRFEEAERLKKSIIEEIELMEEVVAI